MWYYIDMDEDFISETDQKFYDAFDESTEWELDVDDVEYDDMDDDLAL